MIIVILIVEQSLFMRWIIIYGKTLGMRKKTGTEAYIGLILYDHEIKRSMTSQKWYNYSDNSLNLINW